MKSNFLLLLSDRDHLLQLNEIYFNALRRKEDEVDKLTYELKVAMDSVKNTQMALQESENQVDELCLKLSLTHLSIIQEGNYAKIVDIKQIVEGMEDLHEKGDVVCNHEQDSYNFQLDAFCGPAFVDEQHPPAKQLQ